ncbi:MAG: methyl-accepting chemotaxis protein [Kiloniellales bacterium]
MALALTSVRFNQIRTKLTALVLLFGIVPALAIFTVYSASQSEFQDAVRGTIELEAAKLGDVIDRNLFERYGDVQAFGLNTAALDPMNWRNPSSDNPLIRAMNGYMTGYGIYKLMLLLDDRGEVLAVNTVDAQGRPLDTDALYRRSFADADWFRNAMIGQFLIGSNGFTGTAVGQPSRSPVVHEFYGEDDFVITFSAPVKDASGQVIGAWINFADFGLVEQIVAESYAGMAAQGQAHAEVTVLDSNGRVIVDYDPTGQGWTDYRRNWEVIGKLNLAERGVESAVAAVRGETGSMDSLHARKQVLQATGYAHTDGAYDYPGLGWSVLVRIPHEEAYQTVLHVRHTMLIAIAACVVIILAVGLFAGTSAARPIRKLTDAMSRLAEGDKTVEIPATERKDEIGEMAQTVQVFKENALEMDRMREAQAEKERQAQEEKRQAMLELADTFEVSVKSVVDSVSATAAQMQQKAQAMSATAEQTKMQSSAVSAASEEAASNVQTVASATEELTASIGEIGQQVSKSSKIAGDAADQAEKSNVQVESLVAAAQKIGDVVGLIQDIAEQTNLLALNATIEAARAGEAGKGFAVVASEVKSLATQTAKATEEISQQITTMQGATSDSAQAIRGIGEIIKEINEIATTIASAVEEQGSATQEISRNVQQAAAGTQEVSSNIDGVAQAAGEAGKSASEMLGASGELAQQATALSGEVEKFLQRVRAA